MYPVSDRFLKRLAESHEVVTTVQLFTTDGLVIPIDHTDGSVAVDRGQAIRRTCTVTCSDVSLIPLTPTDQLATYGARLRISRGVAFGDGTQELVPLGMFRLDEVGGDPSNGPVTLTGKDLAVIISDDKFLSPYQATGTIVGAIKTLITRSIPDAEIVSAITDVPIGARTWDADSDPWDACIEVAAAAGAEVYCGPDGVFFIAVLPDLIETDPVWAIEAADGGVYVSATRSMSSAGVYNGVLAKGEDSGSSSAPVQFLATDNDPASPTYWDGPYGRRPTTYSSSTLTTVNACSAAANLRLRAAKAPNATGDLSSLPNPALEPGDVIRVAHPDGIRELHQIQSFTVPLAGGDFPIATISAKEGS